MLDFDIIDKIVLGLNASVSPSNLLYCLIGVFLGNLLGAMPGIGILLAVSLLYPITFHIDGTGALIMLAGIYYGTAYGGSIASILLNLPGTPGNAVTCLDGYPMAQKGRAGVALFITTIASFFGGSVGIIILMVFAPVIASFAYSFGAPQYFALMLLGLVAASTVSDGSAIKGLAMVCLGVFFGLVGADMYSGIPRFTFGIFDLYDGISVVVVAMGIFGLAEVIDSAQRVRSTNISAKSITFASMLPTRQEMASSWLPMIRGSAIGSFFGALPGTGSTIAAFMSYGVERARAREPEKFGKGAIEGIMGPESANNAADQTAFLPTLALGIPGTATMAIMLTVLMLHGITPGPGLMNKEPELFWGLVMSFWIGNLMLLVLNIPLIGIWVRVLAVPYHLLYPAILMFVCMGLYSVNQSGFEILLVLIFGIIGYVMRLLDFPAAPMLLGFVLGGLLEENFRRALMISHGDFIIFVQTPISATIIAIVFFILVWQVVVAGRNWQERKKTA